MNIDTKRHKLLGILTEQRKNVELKKEGYNALGVTFENIYSGIDCDKDELHLITSELYTSEEIGYHDANNIVGLFAKDKGVTAFANRKYPNLLISRRKERVKFSITILAFVISGISLYLSNVTNISKSTFDTENKELKDKIDTLQLQVDKLKLNPYNNPNANNDTDSLNVGKN